MGIAGRFLIFFGGIIRYIYGTLWRTIAGRKKFTFNEYLYGPENGDAVFDRFGHTFVNKIVGLITIFIILYSLSNL